MSVLVVICAIVLIAIVLVPLLSIPWLLGFGTGNAGAAIPPESAETRGRLAAMVPPPSAIIGELPTLPDRASLQGVPAIDPPVADLSIIGCGEDKEETNAAIWREVQRALAQRGGKTLPPGGR